MTYNDIILKLYPVSVSGKDQTKKENNDIVKTGIYEVSALALDNKLKTNSNGLYVSGGKNAHSIVAFRVPSTVLSRIHYMKALNCICDLTPLNYSTLIKVKAVDFGDEVVTIVPDDDNVDDNDFI